MIKLEVVTDIDSPSGYSSFARGFCKALSNAGVDIKIVPHKHDRTTIPLDEFWNEHLEEFKSKNWKPDIRMHIETPEFFCPIEGIVNLGFTFWETSKIPGSLHDSTEKIRPNFNWVYQMNHMDEMWTSATFAKDAFSSSGVEKEIRVVPVPLEFITTEEELPIRGITVDDSGNFIPRSQRKIVIGSVAQFNFRKNLEDLIISVCAEFRSNEVVLLLKTYGTCQNDPRQEQLVLNRVRTLKNSLGWKDIPKVVVVQSTLSDLDMAKLYNSMDMYVTTTRGEGFGIPPAQAMASGVFTISTGWSAMTDFIQDDVTGWLVDYQMEPVYGMPHIPWYRPDQLWARINMVDLKDKMRMVYNGIRENSSRINSVRTKGAEAIREYCNPSRIGKVGRSYLEEALGKKD